MADYSFKSLRKSFEEGIDGISINIDEDFKKSIKQERKKEEKYYERMKAFYENMKEDPDIREAKYDVKESEKAKEDAEKYLNNLKNEKQNNMEEKKYDLKKLEEEEKDSNRRAENAKDREKSKEKNEKNAEKAEYAAKQNIKDAKEKSESANSALYYGPVFGDEHKKYKDAYEIAMNDVKKAREQYNNKKDETNEARAEAQEAEEKSDNLEKENKKDQEAVKKAQNDYEEIKKQYDEKIKQATEQFENADKKYTDKYNKYIDLEKIFTDKNGDSYLNLKNKRDHSAALVEKAQNHIVGGYHNIAEAMACIKLAKSCDYKMDDELIQMVNELNNTKRLDITKQTKDADPSFYEKFIQKTQELKKELIQENPENEEKINEMASSMYVEREQRAYEIQNDDRER